MLLWLRLGTTTNHLTLRLGNDRWLLVSSGHQLLSDSYVCVILHSNRPSWHFRPFQKGSGLKMTQTALHCRHIRTLCVNPWWTICQCDKMSIYWRALHENGLFVFLNHTGHLTWLNLQFYNRTVCFASETKVCSQSLLGASCWWPLSQVPL